MTCGLLVLFCCTYRERRSERAWSLDEASMEEGEDWATSSVRSAGALSRCIVVVLVCLASQEIKNLVEPIPL